MIFSTECNTSKQKIFLFMTNTAHLHKSTTKLNYLKRNNVFVTKSRCQLRWDSTQSSTAPTTTRTWCWRVVQVIIHLLTMFFIFISFWFLQKSSCSFVAHSLCSHAILSKLPFTFTIQVECQTNPDCYEDKQGIIPASRRRIFGWMT